MGLMSTGELLRHLCFYGVHIHLSATGEVVMTGDAGRLPADLRAEMEERRAELRAYVAAPPPWQGNLGFKE
jgi:hypothetical protein